MSLIADNRQAAPPTGEATAPPIAWNDPPDVALDLNGPASIPYEPFDPAWLDQPILDLFGCLAARQPDRIAIDDGLLRLTRGQIWAVACRLGRTLADLGAGPGPIAVVLPHAATYWAGVLGCFAAGRAAILLERDTPPERNAEIIADARPAALLTDAEGARRHQAWADGMPTVLIETALLGEGSPSPAARLDPDAPAFIIYTSGSTGRPKGIVQSQRGILNRGMLFIDAAHFGEADRVVLAGALASHVGEKECSLLCGATVYPVDLRRVGLAGLARLIRDQRITVLCATPSMLRGLSRLEGMREFLAGLRLIRTRSEALLHADLRRLRDCLPRECALLYALSATEARMAQWFIPPDDARDPVRVAVGYPTDQSAVLDENGSDCPAGEIGELALRSRCVALGEWQEGRLVPGRMPPDPENPTLRIYHTGDLVRRGTDGVIVVVGRKDRQLKIRGQRVEPIEIEAVLRGCPEVLEAAVLPRKDGEDIRLLAFVVPGTAGDTGLVETLRARLTAALPAYMHPSSISLLDRLPMLTGGKIDAQALLALDHPASANESAGGLSPKAESSAPSHAMVALAWRRVLGQASLDLDLPFDRADGDLIRLLQLVFDLEEQCGARLPLVAFPGDLTPRGFARALDRCLARGLPTASHTSDDPRWVSEVVRMLEAVGRVDEATRELDAALERMPADPLLWNIAVDSDFRTLQDAARAGLPLVGQGLYAALQDRTPADDQLRRSPVSDQKLHDVVVAPPLRGDTLVVVFTGANDTVGIPLPIFDRYLAALGCSTVYLKDFQRLRYLRGVTSLGDQAATLEAIRQLRRQLGCGRVCTIGASAGAFAAIRYGVELGADRILSFAGPTNAEAYFDTALLRRYRAILSDWELDLKVFLKVRSYPSNVFLFFGDQEPLDRAQALYLDGLDGVTLHPVPELNDHQCLRWFALNQDLRTLLGEWLGV